VTWADVVEVLARTAPVLLFLVAVTVLAEQADAAGVFDVAAREAAHLARGRTAALFALVVVLATATTVLLSLDTTAVLLTPVVLAMCAQLRLDPLPFAMATVWLANTTSLLLPVSNLTNLLAQRRLELGALEMAGRMWAPTLAALVVTTGVLWLLHRRRLRGRFQVVPGPRVGDRVLFGAASAGCLLFVVLVAVEVPPPAAAVAGALPVLAAFAVRRREALRWSLVPWKVVLAVAVLFVAVQAAGRAGLTELLAGLTGTGESPADLLRVAAAGAGAGNLVNNLPAYLALEPVAGSTDRLLALLVVVNAGPLVLLWGSLATVLWRERCRARGLTVGAGRFALHGLLLVPPVLLAATAALVATRPG